MNFRLGDIGAAVGRVQLSRLGWSIATRKAVADHYAARLADVAGVRIPRGYLLPGNTFQSFVVELARDPGPVIAALAAAGIGSGPAAHALSMQSVYRKRHPELAAGCDGSGAGLAMKTVALPMFDQITATQVDRVVDALAGCCGRVSR